MYISHDQTLHRVWDPKLMILSYVLSSFGSLATVLLTEEYRWLQESIPEGSTNSQGKVLLFLTAVCFGGISIWTMHWTAIAAFHLETEDAQIVEIQVDVLKSISCGLLAVLMVYFGLVVASKDKFFARTVQQRTEKLKSEILASSSLYEIQKGKHLIRFQALFKDTKFILAGGFIAGSGACLMHYFEMLGMAVNARIEWNGLLITVSAFIAVLGGSLAYWIVFRLLTWKPLKESFRIGSALILAGGVSGMHYTAEMAATYYYDETAYIDPVKPMNFNWFLVSGTAMLISFCTVYYASYKRRVASVHLQNSFDAVERAFIKTQNQLSNPSTPVNSDQLLQELVRSLSKVTESTKSKLHLSRNSVSVTRTNNLDCDEKTDNKIPTNVKEGYYQNKKRSPLFERMKFLKKQERRKSYSASQHRQTVLSVLSKESSCAEVSQQHKVSIHVDHASSVDKK